MSTLTKGPNDMAFVISEANGFRSRENAVVTAAAALEPGSVLGKITASGKYVLHNPAAADGSQAAAGILGFALGIGEENRAVIVRDAEVDATKLTYLTGMSAPNIALAVADLLALGVVVR
jgi:hypothetical protein